VYVCLGFSVEKFVGILNFYWIYTEILVKFSEFFKNIV